MSLHETQACKRALFFIFLNQDTGLQKPIHKSPSPAFTLQSKLDEIAYLHWKMERYSWCFENVQWYFLGTQISSVSNTLMFPPKTNRLTLSPFSCSSDVSQDAACFLWADTQGLTILGDQLCRINTTLLNKVVITDILYYIPFRPWRDGEHQLHMTHTFLTLLLRFCGKETPPQGESPEVSGGNDEDSRLTWCPMKHTPILAAWIRSFAPVIAKAQCHRKLGCKFVSNCNIFFFNWSEPRSMQQLFRAVC